MRLLTLTFTAALSLSAMAHNSECDVSLNGDVTLADGIVTASLANGQQLKLDGQQAWLDNQTLSLNHDQQTLLNRYHEHSVTLAPKVANIALDALDLADDGINLAFGELFGPDDDLVTDLSAEIDEIRSDVQQRFYTADGSLQFDSKTFNETYLSREFEQRLENTVEDAVSRSVGKMMMKIGQQMISGGGSPDAFGKKMENFGERIETQMEAKAEIIEQRATELCTEFVSLNDLENQIQHSIPQLQGLDLIRVNGHRLK